MIRKKMKSTKLGFDSKDTRVCSRNCKVKKVHLDMTPGQKKCVCAITKKN